MITKIRYSVILFCALFFFSCSSTKNSASHKNPDSIKNLHFIGQYILPYNLQYNNTTVGGLSGIDYNPLDNNYYMISDDRSAINPARYYSAQIFLTQKGIDSVKFTGVHYLLQANGNVYPNSKQDPFHTPDPEAMRYNPITNQFIWSSEGERIVKPGELVLENPAITSIKPGGNYIDTFALPSNLVMTASEKGPRKNSVLEGLTFTDNYKNLLVSVEEPLLEDGPNSDVDNGSMTRIMKFDMNTRENVSQYAYPLDAVAHPAIPKDAYKINGIPDILSIGDNKMLVIERSYSTGRLACTIKVYLADMSKATDIKNIYSLQNDKKYVPISKKLLVNMDSLGIYIDNIEGVTFGPILPNGKHSLIFIADNNFNPLEKMQFLLFEVN
ncbi:MAG: esterase-like activity of phytase family protein [Bacteroidetes bacterium]|nr:esterase-like activity of phytase family protein [Bacteroidota bacterium]MBS1756803.1 esterase-like activity of phytase family protein [Bacteroidota bacterium]